MNPVCTFPTSCPRADFRCASSCTGRTATEAGSSPRCSPTLSDHALVAPAGYLKGWNICQESSKAPDVEMVRQLVETLQGFDNVNPNAIRLLGFSNGASLTNRVYVENDNPGIDAVVTVVSQLSDVMNRAETFYEPSGEPDETEPFCGYDQVVQPLQTRRYLNICNVNDNIIPYEGGFSNVGVAFVEARLAAWLVARGKGFDGPPDLGDGEQLADELFKYAYLDDAVVHLRGFAVHGWTADMRDYVSDFLGTWASAPEEDCPADLDGDQSVGGSDLSQILGAWSSNDADADLNGDGTVDGEDLATLLGDWGDC